MDRRQVIGLGLAAAAFSTKALGQTAPSESGDNNLPGDPTEFITLWPGTPPGGEGLTLPRDRVSGRVEAPPNRSIDRVGVPGMDVFRADGQSRPAVIIAPGGGYVRESLDLEGFEIARRLNSAGVTAFVLHYRLPDEGWAHRADVPLQDAQRAMRLVRANADRYGIDPAQLGFMGFSAGGHLATSIATRFAVPVYAVVDADDRVSARPDFVVAMYPVVTMGEGAHAGSRNSLLGSSPTAAEIAAYSTEKTVSAATPPCFVCLAADDPVVPPFPNGIAFFGALRAANVPAELHVFDQGGHGFGIRGAVGRPVAAWPDLLIAWARSRGFFKA